MSRPITPTPKLDKKATRRFLKMVEEGLKHPVGPVPTPKINGVIKQIMSDALKKDTIQVMKMLHEIEKEKCIYNIHYCRVGVGFVFYEGPLVYKDLPIDWKESLSVDKYYPTFEEAVKGEWDRLEETK